jgi:ATP-dependent exoDNAse (exonuclease V) beta subunit
VRRQAEILADSKVEMVRKMERPLTGGASSLEGSFSDRHEEEEDFANVVVEGERSVAMVIGSTIHRIMENLDLDGDLSVQLRECLEKGLSDIDSGIDRDFISDAHERLGDLIDRIAGGNSLQHLASMASGVVGREIAIVAPPQEDRGPTGAVTGFVDLVYRDPDDGRLVVADYKTDAIEGEEALSERARIYEPQVRTYARALNKALDLDAEPHVELWFLAADRIVRF